MVENENNQNCDDSHQIRMYLNPNVSSLCGRNLTATQTLPETTYEIVGPLSMKSKYEIIGFVMMKSPPMRILKM